MNEIPAGQTASTSEQSAPAAPRREPLQLPRGALLAFRVNAPASARELVIYPDGRVSFGGPDEAKQAYARVPRLLNDAHIARLRKTLERANFFRLSSVEDELPPDAQSYEIAARIGNRVHRVVVLESAVPEALQALLQQLNPLLSRA